MHILIISALFPPEPVVSARLSSDIASELSVSNTVTVISPKPSRPFGFQFTNKISSFYFKHIQVGSFICASSSLIGRFRESYSFGKHSYRYIAANNQNIDVIYANTWPLFGQYFAVKAARKYHIPILIHVQDIYPESLLKKLPFGSSFVNRIILPLDKYILGKSSHIIAISRNMKDYLVNSRKISQDKVTVIPNWQDEESFALNLIEPKASKESLFTFMYLGNIGPVAGLDLVLKAYAKANIKNSRLIIAGSGSMKENLMKQAENYLDCIIEFWSVTDSEVPVVQCKADAFLLPLKKGIGLTSSPSKVPAYMFSARPIIASIDKDSDTESVIISANCGWVIEPENIDKLAAMMNEIVLIPKDRMKILGENGRKYALNNFSKKVNVQKLVSLITGTIPS